MKCSYHPGYRIPLPGSQSPNAGPPATKSELLKNLLMAEGLVSTQDLVEPELPNLDTLALVHTREYLHKLESSGLSAAEQRAIGIPWSEALWLRSRLATGGTLLAARLALETGLAANLAGGSHHAFPDHGEGFCVLNDVAVAVAKLRAEGVIHRALIIDLDVHQGNGTAAIFEHVDEVFTFSIHGARNYPALKMRSNVDVALKDGAGDDDYLFALRGHLPRVLEAADADLVLYLAGVDVAAGDRFGKLTLTEEGIRLREREVVTAVRDLKLPLVVLLAGGYAETRERTAELHAHVFREAVGYERGIRPGLARPTPSGPSTW